MSDDSTTPKKPAARKPATPAAPAAAAKKTAAAKPAAAKPAAAKPKPAAAKKPAAKKPTTAAAAGAGAIPTPSPPAAPPIPVPAPYQGSTSAPAAAAPTPPAPPTPPQQAPAAVQGPVPLDPAQERNIAMLAHLVPLLSLLIAWLLPIAPAIAALVFYLVYRDRGPFVRAHTATELNLQITAAIAVVGGWIVGLLLSLVFIGWFVLLAVIAVPILALVFGIIATIRAQRGEWYTYPIAIRFVR